MGALPQPKNDPAQTSSSSELWGAAFRRSNIVGTAYERFKNPQPGEKATPGFDPEVSVPKGYEPVAQIFAGAANAADIEWRRQQFEREQADNRVIQAHGGYGVAASMAAGAVDPLTIASMAIPVAGETMLARAAGTALNAGVTTAAQEVVKRNMEVSGDDRSSALNVGASAVLGGVLGAVLRPHVPAKDLTAMSDRFHEELHGPGGETVMGPIDGQQRVIPESHVAVDAPHPESGYDPFAGGRMPSVDEARQLLAEREYFNAHTFDHVPPEPKAAAAATPDAFISEPVTGEMHVNQSGESTIGAAAVTPTMRGESIARGAGLLSDTIGRVSPGARLMNSPSIESRKLIQELANIPETLTKNYEGVATASPIERELWKYDGVHHQGMEARSTLFRTYRERIAGEGGQPLPRENFNQEIAKAMRRSDQHPIPEVADAAKQTRAIEFNPLKERAVKLGLLPEDVQAKGADSYLMRQYDTQKIKANLTDWLARLKQGFMEKGHDPAEAADFAHSVTRNIQGSERGTMDWEALGGWRSQEDLMPNSGQLKERALDLPDTLLEPYLNNDIDHVAHSYLRSMAPQVEMTERFGNKDMADQITDIKDDYARMIERAPDDQSKAKLYKQFEADVRDLTAIKGKLYGIYGQPKDPGHFAVRAGRLLRSVNAGRLLGAATLAHFPDLGNVMMRFGLSNTLAAVGKVLTSPQAFNLTRSEAKRMGAGLDMAMNATAAMLGDYATHGTWKPQAIANRITRGFTIVTGETPLITAMQQLTSTLASDQIVRSAQKLASGKAVDRNLLARMAGAGLDQDMLGRIAQQHEQFGADVNGLKFGMSDQWIDKAAASAFESAVLRDAHSVTLRPGVGDTPNFMSTELGKALRQFTTFGYAAQRSVVNPLMQGLAHGDPRAATALFSLAAMGTLSYVAKQTAAGQPIEPFDSPRFALEVLDKSNLMGWTSDLIYPALWTLGFKNLSRWSDRDPVETIGGPVVGTVFSTYGRELPGKLLAPLRDDDSGQKGISRSDLHFMRRLMPGQNLWYARNHINSLEDAVGDAFNLPGTSNKDRAALTAE